LKQAPQHILAENLPKKKEKKRIQPATTKKESQAL
jgi:hypothetical protein